MRDRGIAKGKESELVEVSTLDECGWFDPDEFDRSAAGAASLVHQSLVWRAIRIDALGPLKTQVEYYAACLKRVHEQLVENRLVVPPEKERLRRRDQTIGGAGGPADGERIKALVVCAQLAQHGKSAREIDMYLECHTDVYGAKDAHGDESRRLWGNWLAGREERIASYINEAQVFVRGEYRWLVQAQKP